MHNEQESFESNEPIFLSDEPEATPRNKNTKSWILIGLLLITITIRIFSEKMYQNSKAKGWEKITPNNFNVWTVDTIGNLYIVNSSGNVITYNDNNTPTIITSLPSELRNNTIDLDSMKIDQFGRIWIEGFTPNKVSIAMYDPNGTWTIYKGNFDKSAGSLGIILFDDLNQTWVGIDYAIGTINPSLKTDAFSYQDFGLPDGEINAFAINQKGEVWLILDHELISLGPNGVWTSRRQLDEMDQDLHYWNTHMAFDKNDQLWIGSDGIVLSIDRNDNLQTYQVGASYTRISDLLLDSQNRVWISSHENGVYMLDPITGIWINYQPNNSALEQSSVFNLAGDNQGYIWMGSVGWVPMNRVNPSLTESPEIIELYSKLLHASNMGLILLIISIIITILKVRRETVKEPVPDHGN